MAMKRDEALAPLSRQHHQVLYRAMRLKRTEDLSLRDDALSFFAEEDRHFGVEERVLLPAWLAWASEGDHAMARRVAEEHLAIRIALRELSAEAEPAALNRFGELLEAHVRFEERELFPRIEEDLSEAQLEELGAELERALLAA